MSSAIKAPVRIYVIWHPNTGDGRGLAKSVFEWFQQVPGGCGIPVHYRSDPKPEFDRGLPIDIDFDEASLNLLVLLVDQHMVADEEWTQWLDSLASKPNQRIYPVALHSSAFNLPPSIRSLNFITLEHSAGRGTELEASATERRPQMLRKKLTEAFARVLLSNRSLDKAAEAPPPVKIFLSHAKADGRDRAASIRDYIYSETQLTAFYDENDIAMGQSFASVLDDALESGQTAAMLALNSDRYADRPWCRREVQEFRRPRRVPIEDAPGRQLWRLYPLLVVDGLEQHITRCITEFGNARCIRWGDGRQSLYIDTLLRELLFRAYHLQMGQEIAKRMSGECLVINWTPDLPTVKQLLLESEKENIDRLELIYPGLGLSQLELAKLKEYFPKIIWDTFEFTLWNLTE